MIAADGRTRRNATAFSGARSAPRGAAAAEAVQSIGRIALLDPNRVKPFAGQPRKRFRGIARLADSIRKVGQVTPIIVTGCEDRAYDAELVDGERRLRACQSAGLRVRAIFDDEAASQRFLRAVAANFCRQEHDPVEIMQAVLELKAGGLARQEIAEAMGKTPSWVAQYESLSGLAPECLEALKVRGDEARLTSNERRSRGRLTFSLALVLLSLPPDRQVPVMRAIQAKRMTAAQARAYLHRRAKALGVRPSRFRPVRAFGAIVSAVDNCAHVVGRYMQMPGADFGRIRAAAGRDERRRLSERLEALCEELLALSDALGK